MLRRTLTNVVALAARAIIRLAGGETERPTGGETERPRCVSCSRTLRYRRQLYFSRCSRCLKQLRWALYNQQNKQCGICSRPLARRRYRTPWNIDHIQPKATGGTDVEATCNWCTAAATGKRVTADVHYRTGIENARGLRRTPRCCPLTRDGGQGSPVRGVRRTCSAEASRSPPQSPGAGLAGTLGGGLPSCGCSEGRASASCLGGQCLHERAGLHGQPRIS